jgi:hypothetical protein
VRPGFGWSLEGRSIRGSAWQAGRDAVACGLNLIPESNHDLPSDEGFRKDPDEIRPSAHRCHDGQQIGGNLVKIYVHRKVSQHRVNLSRYVEGCEVHSVQWFRLEGWHGVLRLGLGGVAREPIVPLQRQPIMEKAFAYLISIGIAGFGLCIILTSSADSAEVWFAGSVPIAVGLLSFANEIHNASP